MSPGVLASGALGFAALVGLCARAAVVALGRLVPRVGEAWLGFPEPPPQAPSSSTRPRVSGTASGLRGILAAPSSAGASLTVGG